MKPKTPAIFKNVFIISTVVIAGLAWTLKITYESYLTRKKIHEGFLIITAIQNRLEGYADENSGIPYYPKLDNESFGLPNPFKISGTYINQVTALKPQNSSEISLIATVNTSEIPNLENGDDYPLTSPHIRFTGRYAHGGIVWQCSSDLAQRYLPDNCHGT